MKVAGLKDVVAIDASRIHCCALTQAGALWCWGGDNYHPPRLRHASRTCELDEIKELKDVTHFSAGGDHTCAVTKKNELHCWGRNTYGELGNGKKSWKGIDVPCITAVKGTVVNLTAGHNHTCVLLRDSTVKCWGEAAECQLGNGRFGEPKLTPVRAKYIKNVTALSAGTNHTCVLVKGGYAFCWGGNLTGEIGDGTLKKGFVARRVAGNRRWTSIAAGYGFTCGAARDGTAWCWGDAKGPDQNNLAI